MSNYSKFIFLVGFGIVSTLNGGTQVSELSMTNDQSASGSVTLKQAVNGRFLIGAAIMSRVLEKSDTSKLLAEQFDCISAENEMKPEPIHPKPDKFNFEAADRLVAFAKKNNMKVIGHCLCWHQQSPAWMFEGPDKKPLPRDEALANLKNHITAVMTHFKGQVQGWDVVNEAIDDGGRYLRDTAARRAIGDDYIEKAFEFAAAADPSAQLFYNDYLNESGAKREKTIKLIRELKAKGIRVDAVGIQAHWGLGWPELKTIEEAILAYSKEGVKVMFTELDIDVLPRATQGADISANEDAAKAANPYQNGCPEEILQKQAKWYADLFALFVKHGDKITRVTFWGLSDGHSWLNNWPVKGRTNYPLLFDRQLKPKPAFYAVIKTLQ